MLNSEVTETATTGDEDKEDVIPAKKRKVDKTVKTPSVERQPGGI